MDSHILSDEPPTSERGEDDEETLDFNKDNQRLRPKPLRRRRKDRAAIRVNLSACKYEVLRVVLKKLAWKEAAEEDEWQLYWTDTSVSLERVMKLSKTQKINHFCGMLEICRKKKLSANLVRMAKAAPDSYGFHPQTFSLPDDLDAFLESLKGRKRKTFILKPDAGCQGKGIRLVQSSREAHKAIEEFGTATNVVAQKYLAKPFLINGLKFDLRIYVMVASCDPLRLYIFREGLARFCTAKYEPPKAHNLATTYMHLTNYAVNKKNECFQFNTEESASDEGSKWSLSALRDWMAVEGHDYGALWSEVCALAVKTLISIQPLLKHNYRSVLGYENDGFSCFEILGLDIMLDSKLRPWLIECNHSPSFGIDTPLDLNVKEALITDTLKLARIDSRAIRKQKKQDKKAAESRLYGRAKGPQNARRAMTAEEVEVFQASVLEKRDKWEQSVLPGTGYEMIYPTQDAELQRHYDGLLEVSAQLFERTFASRAVANISAIASKKKAEAEEETHAEKRRQPLPPPRQPPMRERSARAHEQRPQAPSEADAQRRLHHLLSAAERGALEERSPFSIQRPASRAPEQAQHSDGEEAGEDDAGPLHGLRSPFRAPGLRRPTSPAAPLRSPRTPDTAASPLDGRPPSGGRLLAPVAALLQGYAPPLSRASPPPQPASGPVASGSGRRAGAPRGSAAGEAPSLPGSAKTAGVYNLLSHPWSPSLTDSSQTSDSQLDILDDHIQSYYIKRLWTGSPQIPYSSPLSRGMRHLDPPISRIGSFAETDSTEQRFSGLTIRGIRPS